MQALEPFPRRRLRLALWVATASLLVVQTTALYLRQGPREVTVDDALSRFRSAPDPAAADDASTVGDASATSATASGAGAAAPTTAPLAGAASPAPGAASAASPKALAPPGAAGDLRRAEEGVYVYATQGYEETNALGGARHDYPAETAATLRRSGCGGHLVRWEPLRERWDESELCPEGEGVSIRRFSTYHEFFQRGQQQDFTCPANSHVFRPKAAPGSRWTWQCSSSDSAIDTDVTFVGFEPMVVKGREVRTAHLLYESRMTGSNRGTQRQERWLDTETGMNVRIKTDVVLETDSPFGTIGYEEHYTITLTSLTPRR